VITVVNNRKAKLLVDYMGLRNRPSLCNLFSHVADIKLEGLLSYYSN